MGTWALAGASLGRVDCLESKQLRTASQNEKIAELRSSREHHFGYAMSHSCESMRSHKVRKVVFRICVCCENAPSLEIVMQEYTGH